MYYKLKFVYFVLAFHFVHAHTASEIRIIRGEKIEQTNVITLRNNHHSSNVFPYALCTIQENQKGDTANYTCDVVLESFTHGGDKYKDSCHLIFYNVLQSADKTLMQNAVVSLATNSSIVFGYERRLEETGEYIYVHRILDIPTCTFHDVQVVLGDREPFLLEQVSVSVRSNDTFGAIYQMPELCGVDVCEIVFSKRGEIISNLKPLTQEVLSIREYLDFKDYYPMVDHGDSKYFVMWFQAHNHNVFHIPFNYENMDITLLKMTENHYTTMETIKLEGLDYEIYGSKGFFDVDISHDSISTCIAMKFHPKEKKTSVRCIQLDPKWNKTVDVQLDVHYNVKMLKVKNLSKGSLALLTHEENGDFYVKRIKSNNRHGRSLVLEKIGNDLVFSSVNTAKLYDEEHGNLCLMSISHHEHFGMLRACFPKKLLS